MKAKISFNCQECGAKSPKWIGRCPECDNWNTYVAEEVLQKPKHSRSRKGTESSALPISEVSSADTERTVTGMKEFDRVMGGGIVPGSLILVGGEPGIGKSTILTQVASIMSRNEKVLYVTAEESTSQVRLRAERLGRLDPDLFLYAENSLDCITREIAKLNPGIVIIDSIQTIFLDEIPSAPGSVSQVRECTARLMDVAKRNSVTIFLVGHVTKDGSIAGPRVLEHLVDTVIYFEGDKGQNYRVLRAIKNRFGSTNEIGLFEMTHKGLVDVPDLSAFFMSNRLTSEPGSSICVAMEGTRPLLVEVQALVSPTLFGMPRRVAMGMDSQRLTLLVAVLEKKVEIPLSNQDVFVNVAGGLKLTETASDVAICTAIASSFRNVALPSDMAFIGEVGLLGEVRPVSQIDTRLKEAANLAFKRAIVPRGQKGKVSNEVSEVSTIEEALEICLLR